MLLLQVTSTGYNGLVGGSGPPTVTRRYHAFQAGCPRKNKPKQDLFRFVSQNQKISVCFGVSNLYRNNRNKQVCFETTRNFLKNTIILSLIKLFQSVFCLFRFNRNTETRCFCRSKTTETNVLFRIVPKHSFGSSFGCFESKLVSVPVSVVSNRN